MSRVFPVPYCRAAAARRLRVALPPAPHSAPIPRARLLVPLSPCPSASRSLSSPSSLRRFVASSLPPHHVSRPETCPLWVRKVPERVHFGSGMGPLWVRFGSALDPLSFPLLAIDFPPRATQPARTAAVAPVVEPAAPSAKTFLSPRSTCQPCRTNPIPSASSSRFTTSHFASPASHAFPVVARPCCSTMMLSTRGRFSYESLGSTCRGPSEQADARPLLRRTGLDQPGLRRHCLAGHPHPQALPGDAPASGAVAQGRHRRRRPGGPWLCHLAPSDRPRGGRRD